jgi:hypothetical protein
MTQSKISTIFKSKKTLTTTLFTFFLVVSLMCSFMNFFTSLIPKVSATSQPPTITKINGETYIAGSTPVFNTTNISIEGDGSPNGLVGVYYSNGNKVCNYDNNGVININEDGKWKCETYATEGTYLGLYTKQKDTPTDLFSANSLPFNFQVQGSILPAPIVTEINGIPYIPGMSVPFNIGSNNVIKGNVALPATGLKLHFDNGIYCNNYTNINIPPTNYFYYGYNGDVEIDTSGNWECIFNLNASKTYTPKFSTNNTFGNSSADTSINFITTPFVIGAPTPAPTITKVNGQVLSSNNFTLTKEYSSNGKLIIEGASSNFVTIKMNNSSSTKICQTDFIKTGNKWYCEIPYTINDFGNPAFLQNITLQEFDFNNIQTSLVSSPYNINLVATNPIQPTPAPLVITKVNGQAYNPTLPIITSPSEIITIEGTGDANKALKLETSAFRNSSSTFITSGCGEYSFWFNSCLYPYQIPTGSLNTICSNRDKVDSDGKWVCSIQISDNNKPFNQPNFQTTFDFKVGQFDSVTGQTIFTPLNTVNVDINPTTTAPSNTLAITRLNSTDYIPNSTPVFTNSRVIFSGTSNHPNSAVELYDNSNQILKCYQDSFEYYKSNFLPSTPTDNNGSWSCLTFLSLDNGHGINISTPEGGELLNNIRARDVANPTMYSNPVNLKINNKPKILSINGLPYTEGSTVTIDSSVQNGLTVVKGTYPIPNIKMNDFFYGQIPIEVDSSGNWFYYYFNYPSPTFPTYSSPFNFSVNQESGPFFYIFNPQLITSTVNFNVIQSNPNYISNPAPTVTRINNQVFVSGSGIGTNPAPNTTPAISSTKHVILEGTGLPFTEMSVVEGVGSINEPKLCYNLLGGGLNFNSPPSDSVCNTECNTGINEYYNFCEKRPNEPILCSQYIDATPNLPHPPGGCKAPKTLAGTINDQLHSVTYFSVDGNGKWRIDLNLNNGIHDLKAFTRNLQNGTEPETSLFQVNVQAPLIATPTAPVITSINQNIITPTTINPTANDTTNSTFNVNGDDLSILFSGTGSPSNRIKLFDPTTPTTPSYPSINFCQNGDSQGFVPVDASGNWKCYSLIKNTATSDTVLGIYAKQYSAYDNGTNTAQVISSNSNAVNYRKIKLLSKPADQTYDTFANFTFPNFNIISAANPINPNANPNLTADCSLDSASFTPCTSITNQDYTGLTSGNHKFTLRMSSGVAGFPTATTSWTWRQLYAGSNCNPPANPSSQSTNYVLQYNTPQPQTGFNISSLFEPIKVSATSSSAISIPHPGISGVDYNNLVGESNLSTYSFLLNNPFYNGPQAPNNIQPFYESGGQDTKFGYLYSGTKIFPTSQPIGVLTNTYPINENFSFDTIPTTTTNTFYNPGLNPANTNNYRTSIEGFYTVVVRNANQDTGIYPNGTNAPVPNFNYALVFFTSYTDFLNLPTNSASTSSNVGSCCNSTPPQSPSSSTPSSYNLFSFGQAVMFDFKKIFGGVVAQATSSVSSSSINIPNPGISGVDYNNLVGMDTNIGTQFFAVTNNPMTTATYPVVYGGGSIPNQKLGFPYTGNKVFPTINPNYFIGTTNLLLGAITDFKYDNIPTTAVNTFYNPGITRPGGSGSTNEGFYTVVIRNGGQDNLDGSSLFNPTLYNGTFKYALVFFTSYADFLNLPTNTISTSSNIGSCCNSTPPQSPSSSLISSSSGPSVFLPNYTLSPNSNSQDSLVLSSSQSSQSNVSSGFDLSKILGNINVNAETSIEPKNNSAIKESEVDNLLRTKSNSGKGDNLSFDEIFTTLRDKFSNSNIKEITSMILQSFKKANFIEAKAYNSISVSSSSVSSLIPPCTTACPGTIVQSASSTVSSTIVANGNFDPFSVFAPIVASAYSQCNYRPLSNDPSGFVSGIVGSPFPAITINNPPINSCPSASFQGAGSATTIPGSIVSDNFVSNSGSIIPLDSLTNPSSGIIKILGSTCTDSNGNPIGDIVVGTNFVKVPGGLVSGIINNPFPTFVVNNNPIFSCPSVTFIGNTVNPTFTGQSATPVTIIGSIINSNFVPNPPTGQNLAQVIPLNSAIIPSTGTLNQTNCIAGSSGVTLNNTGIAGNINIIINTDFRTAPNGSVAGLIGSPYPTINVINNPVNNCVAASFNGAGSNSTINGSIVNGNFVPSEGQVIPLDSLTILSVGTLNQSNCGSNVTILTNFSRLPASGNVAGVVGTPFPSIAISNNPIISCPGLNSATFITTSTNPSSQIPTVIQGSVVNGNFIPAPSGSLIPPSTVPTLGQNIPLNSPVIPAFGIVTINGCGDGTGSSVGNTTIPVTTNFSPRPTGSVAGVIGTTFPNITIVNPPFQNCPTAAFLGLNPNDINLSSTTPIYGSIVNGIFVPRLATPPNSLQIIPFDSFIGSTGIGTISVPGCFDSPISINTNFTPPTTPATPNVTGTVGQPFPPITIINPPALSCTAASFTGTGVNQAVNPGGTPTVINGSIINGNFVPNPNTGVIQNGNPTATIIPLDSVLGAGGTGIIKYITCAGIPNVPDLPTTTNFLPPIIPSGTTSGNKGDTFPTILVSNNPVQSCTTATFQPFGSTVIIQGSIVNGNFVPTAGQIIPFDVTLGNSSGIITQNSTAGINCTTTNGIPTPNITITTLYGQIIPTGSVGGIIGSVFPVITIINPPIQACSLATFNGASSTTTIQGSIVNGNFVPNPTSGVNGSVPIIPLDSVLNSSTGVINLTNCSINGSTPKDIDIITNFQPRPTATITGTVGNPFPTIIVTNNTVVSCPVATFTGTGVNQSVNPGGSPTVITGSIIGGNFVPSLPTPPNAIQIIPLNSVLGNLGTGIITQGFPLVGGPSGGPGSCGVNINVNTNFSPIPAANVTGIRGTTFPTLIVVNNPVTTCAAATFQPFGSSTIIQGSIVNGNFVPNPTSGVNGSVPVIPLDAQLGTSSGILKQTSCGIDVNVVTQFGDPVVSSSVVSSSVISSSIASSSLPLVVIPSTGGIITITNPSSNSSSTPAIIPSAPKLVKPLTISINDPYLCNDDIYGVIDSEDNSQTLITITLTKDDLDSKNSSKDSNSSNSSQPLVFNPSLDKDGNYRIKIDHDNPGTLYYIPEGSYSVSYSVRLSATNQFTEGKPYKAYIINPAKCNPEPILELARTGGGMIAQFTTVVLILIGLVYLGERKRGID